MAPTFLTGVLCQSSTDASETKVKIHVRGLRHFYVFAAVKGNADGECLPFNQAEALLPSSITMLNYLCIFSSCPVNATFTVVPIH